MIEPPRRKRFQIHLSTAVVLMFVAGALIWANVLVRRQLSFGMNSPDDGRAYYYTLYYGWPCEAATQMTDLLKQFPTQSYLAFNLTGIAINLAVALAILFLAGLVGEWLIRRCAARRGA